MEVPNSAPLRETASASEQVLEPPKPLINGQVSRKDGKCMGAERPQEADAALHRPDPDRLLREGVPSLRPCGQLQQRRYAPRLARHLPGPVEDAGISAVVAELPLNLRLE